MSDNCFAGRRKPFAECSRMRALADTMGMSEPQRAKFWLERLAHNYHRGPSVDTWANARDRVARDLGISPSMASRIWHRWREMGDVSGCAMMRLMLAYERICSAAEGAAAGIRAERITLGEENAAYEGARGDRGGVVHAEH